MEIDNTLNEFVQDLTRIRIKTDSQKLSERLEILKSATDKELQQRIEWAKEKIEVYKMFLDEVQDIVKNRKLNIK